MTREARNRICIARAVLLLTFISTGERVALTLYLAYYGVENVSSLGTSAWNAPNFERSARYVEERIVDGFYPGSEQPRTRDLWPAKEIYGENRHS
jgi:hypothetical protein